jgi:hypothetical protein
MPGQFNKKAAWISVYYLQSSKSSSSPVGCLIVPQVPLSMSQFFTQLEALYFRNTPRGKRLVSNRAAGETRAGAGKGRITSKGTLQWVGDSGDLYELAGWMALLWGQWGLYIYINSSSWSHSQLVQCGSIPPIALPLRAECKHATVPTPSESAQITIRVAGTTSS